MCLYILVLNLLVGFQNVWPQPTSAFIITKSLVSTTNIPDFYRSCLIPSRETLADFSIRREYFPPEQTANLPRPT
ncbi:hypothetical protein K503DRAFT_142121 [Rhizopogon vinicolor AM-OR11-026]|uniref:Secreted protein n=1 Tax=Rhizopogon vinicolor AM-OR11-026 TaxID=1314800 RepID=A0A1B7NF17_9AGAM|nr:hypothetical protein K503DRAFT_142121 [Rhizopogon vinicolor AM-OR11-026]